MSSTRGRDDADSCFVCGPKNTIGLHISFRIENDVCLGQFTPGDMHCGFDGVTHGGILFSALDDVMANWLFLKGMRGFTAKCDIRFKQVLPIGCTIQLEGHCVKQRRKLIVMQGLARRADNDELVAECEASFMVE